MICLTLYVIKYAYILDKRNSFNTCLSLLSIRGLKTHFFTSKGTVKAVDGVDLDINKKEAVGLVGETGCGKTCTALSIMRLIPLPGRIIEGQILYKEKDLLSLTEVEMRQVRGKEITMIFQDPFTFLNPLMKVGEQVAESILSHTEHSPEDSEVTRLMYDVLKRVRLPYPERTARFYPYELSGGMRQRVMTAMAVSCNPALLIADEPTTALDVTIQAQILELIKQLKEELGLSLLLITHNLGIVSELCDRVYVMYAGKVIEYGDIFQIFEAPVHPYTIGLLKSALSMDRLTKKLEGIQGSVPNMIDPPEGCRFHPRCFKAKPQCNYEEPSLVEIEKNHWVSCFF